MGLFSFLFGKPMTPAELVRKNQRVINKAIRDMEREMHKMEAQERKLLFDIKKAATSSQMELCRLMARDLVRTRTYIKKFLMMKANLQAVSMTIMTIRSQQAMADAMKGVTIALWQINGQMRLPQIKMILREFERQANIMEVKEELINESTEQTIGEENQEEESDELVTQVLDELGLELQHLPETPGAKKLKEAVPMPEPGANQNSNEDDELQTRLDNLRRGK